MGTFAILVLAVFAFGCAGEASVVEDDLDDSGAPEDVFGGEALAGRPETKAGLGGSRASVGSGGASLAVGGRALLGGAGGTTTIVVPAAGVGGDTGVGGQAGVGGNAGTQAGAGGNTGVGGAGGVGGSAGAQAGVGGSVGGAGGVGGSAGAQAGVGGSAGTGPGYTCDEYPTCRKLVDVADRTLTQREVQSDLEAVTRNCKRDDGTEFVKIEEECGFSGRCGGSGCWDCSDIPNSQKAQDYFTLVFYPGTVKEKTVIDCQGCGCGWMYQYFPNSSSPCPDLFPFGVYVCPTCDRYPSDDPKRAYLVEGDHLLTMDFGFNVNVMSVSGPEDGSYTPLDNYIDTSEYDDYHYTRNPASFSIHWLVAGRGKYVSDGTIYRPKYKLDMHQSVWCSE